MLISFLASLPNLFFLQKKENTLLPSSVLVDACFFPLYMYNRNGKAWTKLIEFHVMEFTKKKIHTGIVQQSKAKQSLFFTFQCSFVFILLLTMIWTVGAEILNKNMYLTVWFLWESKQNLFETDTSLIHILFYMIVKIWVRSFRPKFQIPGKIIFS